MSYDDMKAAWKSPVNHPSADELERERLALVHTLRRGRRAFVIRIALALAWAAVPVVALVLHLVRGGALSVQREWAFLLLLALPLAGAALFIRRQVQHHRAHTGFEQSVRHALAASLDANRAAQHRARIIEVLLALCVPLLAIGIWQLQVVGKARSSEAISLACFMAGVIAVSLFGLAWERRRLRPAAQRLAGLLSALEV